MMITAQDIREKTFATVRRDGYDMDVVDNFLDELANETEAAQKENAVLKSKMKVLVDKIEEYRANEEAAQRALLSAQKLAIQIEGDARTRAAAMIADAEKQVQAKIGSIAQATRDEENRLAAAKAATARYIEEAKEAFGRQYQSLENVARGFMPDEPKEEPAPAPAPAAVEDTVRSIEDSVARLQADGDLKLNLDLSVDESKEDGFRTLPLISASAAKKADGSIILSLTNVSLDKAKEIEVSLDDTKVKNVSGRILTSKNVADYNDFEHPDKVQPAEFKGAKVKKGKLTVKVPAKSIIVLDLKS